MLSSVTYLQLHHAISEVLVAISREKNEYHSRLHQKLIDPIPVRDLKHISLF